MIASAMSCNERDHSIHFLSSSLSISREQDRISSNTIAFRLGLNKCLTDTLRDLFLERHRQESELDATRIEDGGRWRAILNNLPPTTSNKDDDDDGTNGMTMANNIPSKSFYGEFHGHKLHHLHILYPHLRANSDALIWTAGDSSLDNKYWFRDHRPAVAGGYAQILDPPRSVCDVTYWLNKLLLEDRDPTSGGSDGGGGSHGSDGGHNENSERVKRRYAAINTAVEATTLNERCIHLRPQDRFLRDNISSEDVLIVSIGGNDIALCPTPCTIVSMAGLICLPMSWLEGAWSFGSAPVNDCCCGCGPSLASCLCSCPPCFGYFRHLFGTRTQKYIEAITAKTKPKKILVCMIYYPDTNNVPSWANAALGALGYNRNPAKLQLLIRKMFEEATSTIRIPGSEVIPVPLFVPLDGTNSEDYVARVEPSALGGKKMAEYLLHFVQWENRHVDLYVAPPTISFVDR